jgi:hypothetical protein
MAQHYFKYATDAPDMRIEWETNSGNLWTGSEEGIDLAASADRYYEMMLAALSDAYSTAEIAIEAEGAVGYERGFSVFADSGIDDEAVREHCQAIMQRVFENGEWYVEADDAL